MNKLLVIGVSGAGKSTVANRLSAILNLPFFPSDGFYWEDEWRLASPEKVRQRLMDALSHDKWILDGNFDNEHEFVWKQADRIIWLDYSLPTILKQVIARNLRWTLTRQTVWSGNQMTLPRAVSGIHHALRSYAVKQETHPRWLSELRGVDVYRFCSRKETELWLKSLV
ncbi:MAG: hypothetical protein HY867_01595 [Chloroflexi bacterium]|nr:hypothetical protein [Chloroflexota bacterium]